jgi:CheY-like chemotaxis protein
VQWKAFAGTILRQEKDGRTLALEAYVMDNAKPNKVASKILIADDDPCVLRAVADRCARVGFKVETATDGLKALIKASQYKPDTLIIDVHMPEVDGLSVCAFLQDIAKQLPQVMVVTGRSGQEILGRCEDLDAICIHKGNNFWNELDAGLSEICPERADAITRCGKQPAKIDVKKRPRVLLVDDDISVKKMFFHRFENVGAELLYSRDAPRGYWTARRHQPTVIVADYCMPNGNAEYLLSRLRDTAETRSIPVIVQTGRRLDDVTRRRLCRQISGLPGGATRIVQKSLDAEELFEALQRLCGFPRGLNGEPLYQ